MACWGFHPVKLLTDIGKVRYGHRRAVQVCHMKFLTDIGRPVKRFYVSGQNFHFGKVGHQFFGGAAVKPNFEQRVGRHGGNGRDLTVSKCFMTNPHTHLVGRLCGGIVVLGNNGTGIFKEPIRLPLGSLRRRWLLLSLLLKLLLRLDVEMFRNFF